MRAYWRVDRRVPECERLGNRHVAPSALNRGSNLSIELQVCSVISSWTGLPVFFWTIVALSRTTEPVMTLPTWRRTRSQARSLLSKARLKSARSRVDPDILRRTRMDQTCLGRRGRFCPMSSPLFQGREVDVFSLMHTADLHRSISIGLVRLSLAGRFVTLCGLSFVDTRAAALRPNLDARAPTQSSEGHRSAC